MSLRVGCARRACLACRQGSRGSPSPWRSKAGRRGQDPRAKRTEGRRGLDAAVLKGIGAINLRVSRDRTGRFERKIVPGWRRYEEAVTETIDKYSIARFLQ